MVAGEACVHGECAGGAYSGPEMGPQTQRGQDCLLHLRPAFARFFAERAEVFPVLLRAGLSARGLARKQAVCAHPLIVANIMELGLTVVIIVSGLRQSDRRSRPLPPH
jgi:hypothetical protein